jgi:hypothetical protein
MYVCMYMQMYANGNSGNFMMYYFNFTLVQFIITNHIFILSLSLSIYLYLRQASFIKSYI